MAAGATAQRRKVVMVSSTARDLPLHREQVRLACERAGFEPRWMMEHLPALNDDAVRISLRMVEEADVYLGILAYRYGTVPTGYEISITEMEYNRAVELDKPRLVFFIHEDHQVRASDVETGFGTEKLNALKARIAEQRVAAFFKSPEDLRSHVGEALRNLAAETPPQPTAPLPPLGPIKEYPPLYPGGTDLGSDRFLQVKKDLMELKELEELMPATLYEESARRALRRGGY